MPGTKSFYFAESIGQGDWFSYGTTLQDVRYAVEGYGIFEDGAETALPENVILHFPACMGGDVVEGYAIYNYIRDLAAKGVKTTARIEGLCASIAVLCAIACDTVEMADAALLMVHKPSSDGWSLTADDMRAAATLLDTIQAQLVSRYVARTGMSAETANELINRTTWMGADEAMTYGFVTSKIADTPIVAPAGTEAVLNYYPKSKPAPTMAISPAEKKGIVDDVLNGIKNFFGGTPPKNHEDTPTVAPVVVPVLANASSDVTDQDPLYYDGELVVGTAVYSDEAMTIAYADGEYVLADTRPITIAEGMVSVLGEVAADNSAVVTEPVTNAADAALVAQNTELATQNALLQRKLTAATNKLKAVVPGSTGTPTPAGAAQNIIAKPGTPKNTATSMVSLTPPTPNS